jgi:LmbE family N-acetylglucosaminyl deacetylase
LGAHSDDIEIGAGGTILGWVASATRLEVHWCVLSAESRVRSRRRPRLQLSLPARQALLIELVEFRNGYFPYQGKEIKGWLEVLQDRVDPTS